MKKFLFALVLTVFVVPFALIMAGCAQLEAATGLGKGVAGEDTNSMDEGSCNTCGETHVGAAGGCTGGCC